MALQTANNDQTATAIEKKHASHHRETKVSFGEVETLYFAQELGDHPGVSEGAPLTIGWEPIARSTAELEVFEYMRKPARRPRKELQIPGVEREIL